MQNLILFLTKFSHWILFIVLELVSGVMLFSYNSYQGSVWISTANSVAGQVYEWQSEVDKFFSLVELNRILTRRNVELELALRKVHDQSSAAPAEVVGDSLEMRPLLTDSVLDATMLLQAQVVKQTLNAANNLITINKGEADGVTTDMGVVSGTGVVGVVYMTGKHYAVVLPILNARSRISCAVRNKHYFGFLSWTGGDERYAYVEGIPRHAQFELGEWIETNGYSAIFPPGITVGRIVSIGNSADGLSYRLRVKLTTDFSCLRDVSIITDENIAERLQILSAARDSMALAN